MKAKGRLCVTAFSTTPQSESLYRVPETEIFDWIYDGNYWNFGEDQWKDNEELILKRRKKLKNFALGRGRF